MSPCIPLLTSWIFVVCLVAINFIERRRARRNERELIAQLHEVIAAWNGTIASLEKSTATVNELVQERWRRHEDIFTRLGL
jgi:hypothetical protein